MKIETHSSIEAFFQGLIEESLSNHAVVLSEDSSAYLVALVDKFASQDALYAHGKPEEPGTPALVWLLERAQRGDPRNRFEAFRHLGDVALIVSGLFSPHIERDRSLVGTEYYVGMGQNAYQNAADLSHRSGFRGLLSELAGKFKQLVEVLTNVAERTTLPVSEDVCTLYERLMRNPDSEQLTRRLMEQGFVPIGAAA